MLSDLDWLVRARNDIQSLMPRLLQRWDQIEYWQRPVAVSAAFSLWRAVFLLVEREHDAPSELVEETAHRFLIKLIRTNTIAFADGCAIAPFQGSPPATVRESWHDAFDALSGFVAGTVPGTVDENPDSGIASESS